MDITTRQALLWSRGLCLRRAACFCAYASWSFSLSYKLFLGHGPFYLILCRDEMHSWPLLGIMTFSWGRLLCGLLSLGAPRSSYNRRSNQSGHLVWPFPLQERAYHFWDPKSPPRSPDPPMPPPPPPPRSCLLASLRTHSSRN